MDEIVEFWVRDFWEVRNPEDVLSVSSVLEAYPELLNYRPHWAFHLSDPSHMLHYAELEAELGPSDIWAATATETFAWSVESAMSCWTSAEFTVSVRFPLLTLCPISEATSVGEDSKFAPRVGGCIYVQGGWIHATQVSTAEESYLVLTCSYAWEDGEQDLEDFSLNWSVAPEGWQLPHDGFTARIAGTMGWLHSGIAHWMDENEEFREVVLRSTAYEEIVGKSDIKPLFSRWMNKGSTC